MRGTARNRVQSQKALPARPPFEIRVRETCFIVRSSQSDLTSIPKTQTDAWRYSILSAFMGEMEAARLAGMMAAKKEQIASDIVATLSAGGSQEETPYN
jgi:hypothetical protein